MSSSKPTENGMLQISSFFNWITIWSSFKLFLHISWLFLQLLRFMYKSPLKTVTTICSKFFRWLRSFGLNCTSLGTQLCLKTKLSLISKLNSLNLEFVKPASQLKIGAKWSINGFLSYDQAHKQKNKQKNKQTNKRYICRCNTFVHHCIIYYFIDEFLHVHCTGLPTKNEHVKTTWKISKYDDF